MKTLFTPLALILLAVSLVANVLQWREFQASRERAAALAATAENDSKLRVESAEKIASLTSKTEAFASESEQLRAKLSALTPEENAPDSEPKPTAEAAPKKGNAMMKNLAKMMKDPAMRETMKAQQTMALPMLYGDFVKSLGLNSKETGEFYKLLADRQMEVMEASFKLMESGTAQLAENAKAMSEQKKISEQGLHDFLGEERTRQFSNYENSMGDRFTLNQLNQKLASSSAQLADHQSAALMKIMAEERTASNQPANLNNDPAKAMELMKSDAGLDNFLSRQESTNQRVLTRAMSILTPDQFKQFEEFQKQQINMQRAGIKMSREMMNP